MMSDLIDRQAAIDMVLKYAKRLYEPVGTPEDKEMYSYGRGLLIGIERNLKQLPSAEPKTAVWIGEGDGYVDGEIILDTWYCSNCNYCPVDDEKPNWNYCPNCGAKMETEE